MTRGGLQILYFQFLHLRCLSTGMPKMRVIIFHTLSEFEDFLVSYYMHL